MATETSVDRDGVRERMTGVDSASPSLLLVGTTKVEVDVASTCIEVWVETVVELEASNAVTMLDVIVENAVLLDSSTNDVVRATSVGVRAIEGWLSDENNVSEASTVVSEVLLEIEPSLDVGTMELVKMTDDENVSPAIDVTIAVVSKAVVGSGIIEVGACSEENTNVNELEIVGTISEDTSTASDDI